MVDGSESTGRAFASMLLVKTQGDLTWRQAAAALELPERLGYSLARTGAARLNTDTGTFVEAVLDHTRCHSAAPVDYRAKEHIAMTDFRPQPALAQLRAHLRPASAGSASSRKNLDAVGTRTPSPRGHNPRHEGQESPRRYPASPLDG